MPPHEYTRLRMLMTSCIWYIYLQSYFWVKYIKSALHTPLLQPYSRSSAGRMLKVFILACCLAVASYGDPNAQFGGYPVSYPFSFPQKQNYYSKHPISSSNKYVGEDSNQKTFGLLGGALGGLGYWGGWGRPYLVSTTVFSTSVITFTCTRSTSSTCAGRRRRMTTTDILDGRKSKRDEQFSSNISPSKILA